MRLFKLFSLVVKCAYFYLSNYDCITKFNQRKKITFTEMIYNNYIPVSLQIKYDLMISYIM